MEHERVFCEVAVSGGVGRGACGVLAGRAGVSGVVASGAAGAVGAAARARCQSFFFAPWYRRATKIIFWLTAGLIAWLD
jgi:hypothetical protein